MIAITIVATAATLFAISALLIYRESAQAHNNTRIELEEFTSKLSDADAAQRGYLLTGHPSQLEAYKEAVADLPGLLQGIKDRAQDDSQRIDAANLAPLVERKLGDLQNSVNLRDSGSQAEALAAVESGTGEALTNQIRSITQQIQDGETRQLREDRTRINWLGQLARDISIVSLLAILALASMVYYIYIKAIQSERLLDRAKDEFVSLASHQLRTPATGIKSILSTLMAGDFGPMNDRQTYFIRRALESNARELSIIEELLNVAKADAGRLILHATPFDLSALLQSITAEQRPAIEEKNQTLNLKLPSHEVQIVADEEKLYMAIGNLVDNARKYTPEGGSISVSMQQRHGSVRIEVADSGIGIDPAEVKHIFDRFHRASDTLSGNVDGAGLGLYLAGRIVELHEGTIEVTSKLGKGTKFVMILPQGDRHAAEGSAS